MPLKAYQRVLVTIGGAEAEPPHARRLGSKSGSVSSGTTRVERMGEPSPRVGGFLASCSASHWPGAEPAGSDDEPAPLLAWVLPPDGLQLPDGEFLELGAATGGEDLDGLTVTVGEDLFGDGALTAISLSNAAVCGSVTSRLGVSALLSRPRPGPR
jgi:hypothetical protein